VGHGVGPSPSIADAIRHMCAEKVGAVLVPDAEALPGRHFSTERGTSCACSPTLSRTSRRLRVSRG